MDADPCDGDQAEECLTHFDATLRHYGVDLGMRIARKHLVAYGSGVRDAAQYRAQVAVAPTPEAVETLVRRYLDRLDKAEIAQLLCNLFAAA